MHLKRSGLLASIVHLAGTWPSFCASLFVPPFPYRASCTHVWLMHFGHLSQVRMSNNSSEDVYLSLSLSRSLSLLRFASTKKCVLLLTLPPRLHFRSQFCLFRSPQFTVVLQDCGLLFAKFDRSCRRISSQRAGKEFPS